MEVLVPGRACSACTLCCTVLSIDTPRLQKVPGVTCDHCAGGCAIHTTRPDICRQFFCAWRTLEILSSDWRPDMSGIFAQLETEDIPDSFAMRTAISLMLVGPNPIKTIRQKQFIDFVVTGIKDGIPIFLSLPGPKGHEAAKLILNTDEMQGAIASPVANRVKDVLEKSLKRLQGHTFKAHVMRNATPGRERQAANTAAAALTRACLGSRTIAVVPWAGLLSRAMLPPCISTSPRQTESPRPVPS